ncbi:MAG TPA: nitrous oxide reductase accessory protein NosL [Candidatus Eisenbacteria bacterium]|nr:nitrous oxide reductase accessory protein NosL [Candidatus Eisenbacteria bacterium]
MTSRRRAAAAAALLPTLLLTLAAGCGDRDGSKIPATVDGGTCVSCGMEIRNPRYAAAWIVAGRVRPFDSIECALQNAGAEGRAGRATPSGTERSLYLSDFASGSLHRADSLWVVRAKIPSPMGGGFAAFLDRAEAERIAAAREGSVSTAAALLGDATEAR